MLEMIHEHLDRDSIVPESPTPEEHRCTRNACLLGALSNMETGDSYCGGALVVTSAETE